MTFRSLQNHLSALNNSECTPRLGLPGHALYSWLHRSNDKQECWQVIPGEKSGNWRGVPTFTAKNDARADAVQWSSPNFSGPCIQPGLAKPHLWPHLAPCLLPLSCQALNKVHNSTITSVFGMSPTISKRALNVKCVRSLCFRTFRGKSTSFKISRCRFYLHAVG